VDTVTGKVAVVPDVEALAEGREKRCAIFVAEPASVRIEAR